MFLENFENGGKIFKKVLLFLEENQIFFAPILVTA